MSKKKKAEKLGSGLAALSALTPDPSSDLAPRHEAGAEVRGENETKSDIIRRVAPSSRLPLRELRLDGSIHEVPDPGISPQETRTRETGIHETGTATHETGTSPHETGTAVLDPETKEPGPGLAQTSDANFASPVLGQEPVFGPDDPDDEAVQHEPLPNLLPIQGSAVPLDQVDQKEDQEADQKEDRGDLAHLSPENAALVKDLQQKLEDLKKAGAGKTAAKPRGNTTYLLLKRPAKFSTTPQVSALQQILFNNTLGPDGAAKSSLTEAEVFALVEAGKVAGILRTTQSATRILAYYRSRLIAEDNIRCPTTAA